MGIWNSKFHFDKKDSISGLRQVTSTMVHWIKNDFRIMRVFLLGVFILSFALSLKSQTFEKSVFIQDFNNNIVENIVLKLPPNRWDKKYLGYTLFIFVSNSEEVSVSYSDRSLANELVPIDREIERNFIARLEGFDLSQFKGCLLVYPVLFILRSSKTVEDNFREAVKSMMPLLKFENVSCIQFQETLIGSGKRGV